MVLALRDRWVWDSWYVLHEDVWHAFFLQADKSLKDPELRHWNVSIGHATSSDLVDWTYLGTCFAPSDQPAWDDNTTWTGSVVRGDDDLWHLFYTGTNKADGGLYQRIGHAVSDDLHSWRRIGNTPALDCAPPYEDHDPDIWHDRAFRDPWVMRDPEGDGWLMYFTARRAGIDNPLEAGCIGFATSPDLQSWTLQDPVYTGAAGHLEVPQVFGAGDRWFCLFCTNGKFWAPAAAATLGGSPSGTHYLVGTSPRGPWRLAPGPVLDGAEPVGRYAARIVDDAGTWRLLGFRWFGADGATFVGEIDNPETIEMTADGRLAIRHHASVA